MPRDAIHRKDISDCHQVVLQDLFREVPLVQVTAHTQHSKTAGVAWEVNRADVNLAKGLLHSGIEFPSCCSPSRNLSPHLI